MRSALLFGRSSAARIACGPRSKPLTCRLISSSGSRQAADSGTGLTEDEKREAEAIKKEREIKAAQERRLRESKTPLAKWIRNDPFSAERERLRGVVERIRELYPERAAAADEFVKSLDMGVILQQAQKEYPEFGQKVLEDEEVFDALAQFIDEKDLDPTLMKTRQSMGAAAKAAAAKRDAEVAKLDELRKKLAADFPEAFDILSDGKVLAGERLPIDHPLATKLKDETLEEMYEGLLKPVTTEPISKADFFNGVDRRDQAQLRAREEQWAKYQQLLAQAKRETEKKETKPVEPTADQEPVIEAAGNFDRLFTRASLGKYIRWNEREQRKYLPEGWCSKIEQREFEQTNETSLLIREDALTAIGKLESARAACFTRKGPRPILLTGERGVGKSCVLQEVVYWARKADWLVFNVKSGLKWTQSGGIISKSKIMPGCWDQPYLAAKMLGYFMDAHMDKLKTIPLRTAPQVGKFEGKTLFDLVEYGAALHEIATDALFHARNELTRVIEYPVLIAIDDYNELYNYSQTWRNPESTRFKPEKIQNRQLTLTKLFLDCHRDPKLINGTFIGAISWELTMRHFDLEKEAHPDWIEVQPYSIEEMERVMAHYKRTKAIYANTSTGTNAALHQLILGNGGQLIKWTIGI